MYVTNRKRGYKIIRKYKTSPRVKLLSFYGAEFNVTLKALAANGYKTTKNKPATFRG